MSKVRPGTWMLLLLLVAFDARLAAFPAILTPPRDTLVQATASATFSVTATGSGPLDYQWRRNGAPLPGATAATYTISPVSRGDAGYYDVVVTEGNASVTSTPVRLAVAPVAYPAVTMIDPAWDLELERNGGNVSFLAPLPDGGFMAAGAFSSVSGAPRWSVARFNPDGSLNSNFIPAKFPSQGAVALAVQPDGKPLVAYDVKSSAGTLRRNFARLNTDGSVDAGFEAGLGSTRLAVEAVLALPNGKILVSSTVGGTAALQRLNADGALDATFAVAGAGNVNAFALQPDGKILVAGTCIFTAGGMTRRHVVRFNADGSLDATFDAGTGSDGTPLSLAVRPDGGIAVGGAFTQFNGRTARRLVCLTASGAVDQAFATNLGTGFDSPVANLQPPAINAIQAQADGKLLVAGDFTSCNGTERWYFLRLNADGTLDSFVPPRLSIVRAMIQTEGGHLVLGGVFRSVGTAARDSLARFSSTGVLDAAVNCTFRDQAGAGTIFPLPGGKFLVSGSFNYSRGQPANGLLRVNADGTRDPTFDAGAGVAPTPGTWVTCAAALSDGRIAIGGFFQTYQGVARRGIALLKADGSLDPSFAPGPALVDSSARVYTLAVLPGNRLLAGGAFATFGVAPRGNIVALEPDGSVSTAFNVGAGFDGSVLALLPQADGKVVVGGGFNNYDGTAASRLVRLQANGAIDPTFLRGGPNSTVYAIAPAPDGRLVIGGTFTAYQGMFQEGVARIFAADGQRDESFAAASIAGGVAGLIAQEDGGVIVRAHAATGIDPFDIYGQSFLRRFRTTGEPDTTFRNHDVSWEAPVGTTLVMRDDGQLLFNRPGGFSGTRAASPPRALSLAPLAAATLGGTTTLLASAERTAPISYQWYFDGAAVAGANDATLTLANASLAQAGLYRVVATSEFGASATQAFVGLAGAAKATGGATEVGANITHPNGNIYDQLLLTGAAAAVTADAKQITRVSFTDLTGDIVQVEFSGAGTLTLLLDGSSGPEPARNYNQPEVAYMRGHVGLVVTGADETSNLSVFSVGRVTAANPALFRDVFYDGFADLAYIAIASRNGKFGGIRAANANFFATRNITGIYAPGVEFTGPIYLFDLNASGTAQPMIVVGSVADARVTGGDMLQANGAAVQVRGLAQLRFTAGSSSHGVNYSATRNRARFEQDGVDVTDRIVVNP